MSPQRDQEVELPGVGEQLDEQPEQLGQRHAARVVGDQGQHARAAKAPAKPGRQGFPDAVFGQQRLIRRDGLGQDGHVYTPANALNPPSTGTTMPVTNLLASVSSHRTVPSRSSGFPKRPIGV